MNSRPTKGAYGVPLLTGPDRALMDAQMGLRDYYAPITERCDDGTLVLRTVRPTELRRLLAANDSRRFAFPFSPSVRFG